MLNTFAPQYVVWIETVLALTISVTIIAALAYLASIWQRSATRQRSVWQAATLICVVVLGSELLGITRVAITFIPAPDQPHLASPGPLWTVDLIWRTGAVRPAVSAASNESDKFRPGARMWVMLGSAHRTQPRALRPPFAVGANKSTGPVWGGASTDGALAPGSPRLPRPRVGGSVD